MKISKDYQHEYVCCLPIAIEKAVMIEVKKNVSELWLSDEEKAEAIENANCSKVCDLEDTIAIQYVA